MKKIRKIGAFLCLGLLLLLAACGAKETDGEKKPENVTAAATPEEAAPTEDTKPGEEATPAEETKPSEEAKPTEPTAPVTSGGEPTKAATATPTTEPTQTPKPTPTKKPTQTPTPTRKPEASPTKSPVSQTGDKGEMRNLTTMELVRDMGIGINLGNTFESCGDWITGNTPRSFETAWGSPVITEAMIAGMADAGFGVLRIPVAWSNMMGEDYTISSAYIKRVKEVIDWAISNDMYVIVNIHWDGGWWEKFSTEKSECMYRYTRMWTQLCEAFRDYGDRLMFESLNEEGCWNDIWNRYGGTNGKSRAYALLNEINQKFVDVVRKSGGNNAKRHLLIAGYATDISLTCDRLFQMPSDPAGRMAVSVHYYTPVGFCILEEDASWGKVQTEWGSSSDLAELKSNMRRLYDTFISKGIPVIMGEYGCVTKNKTQEQIRNFLATVCRTAYDAGICPVLWDINYTENSSWSVYNRHTCKINDSALAKIFLEISKGKQAPKRP